MQDFDHSPVPTLPETLTTPQTQPRKKISKKVIVLILFFMALAVAASVALLLYSGVIGTNMQTLARNKDFQIADLPQFPSLVREELNETDRTQFLDGLKKSGYNNPQFEFYLIKEPKHVLVIVDFYKTEMEKQGWTVTSDEGVFGHYLRCQKGTREVMIMPFIVGGTISASQFPYLNLQFGDEVIVIFSGIKAN